MHVWFIIQLLRFFVFLRVLLMSSKKNRIYLTGFYGISWWRRIVFVILVMKSRCFGVWYVDCCYLSGWWWWLCCINCCFCCSPFLFFVYIRFDVVVRFVCVFFFSYWPIFYLELVVYAARVLVCRSTNFNYHLVFLPLVDALFTVIPRSHIQQPIRQQSQLLLATSLDPVEKKKLKKIPEKQINIKSFLTSENFSIYRVELFLRERRWFFFRRISFQMTTLQRRTLNSRATKNFE